MGREGGGGKGENSQFNMGAEVNLSFTSDCDGHCLTCILYTHIYTYIHCIYTVYTLYMHSIYTYIHCIYSVYTVYIQCI